MSASNKPTTLFRDLDETHDPQRKSALASVGSVLELQPAGTPNADQFAAFFRDLDSYTQYWKAYRPELQGKYMKLAMKLIQGPTIKAWQNWAVNEQTAAGQVAKQNFEHSLTLAGLVDDVMVIDGLLLMVLKKHFPGAAGGDEIDSDRYLAATEAFARDNLPIDNDRLARVGGGGDDVSHHRMDSPGMWFNWAAVVDCAAKLPAANGGGPKPYRSLLVAAAAFGSAMDCVFRGSGSTRPEYGPNAATETLLRAQARNWSADPNLASQQARELFALLVS